MILPLIIIIIIILFVLRQRKQSANASQKGSYGPPIHARACGHATVPAPAPAAASVEPFTADYHEFMVNSEIAPSVVDSHKSFVKDLVTTTTGASADTVKSNAEYDNVPWGLPRSTVFIPISENSRTTSSATTEVLKDEYAGNVYGIL
jgi:hypothetical protein